MYGPLSYILLSCTTIRANISVLINLYLLFAHDHSTKIRGHSYYLTYFFLILNCANISHAMLMSVLSLYFIRYIHGHMTAEPKSADSTLLKNDFFCFVILKDYAKLRVNLHKHIYIRYRIGLLEPFKTLS